MNIEVNFSLKNPYGCASRRPWWPESFGFCCAKTTKWSQHRLSRKTRTIEIEKQTKVWYPTVGDSSLHRAFSSGLGKLDSSQRFTDPDVCYCIFDGNQLIAVGTAVSPSPFKAAKHWLTYLRPFIIIWLAGIVYPDEFTSQTLRWGRTWKSARIAPDRSRYSIGSSFRLFPFDKTLLGISGFSWAPNDMSQMSIRESQYYESLW